MRKTIIAIAVISICTLLGNSTLRAQESTEPAMTPEEEALAELTDPSTPKSQRVLTKGFWSNWSITGAIGTQFYYGENDKYMDFKDQWTFPNFDIYLNKWVTPSFGWGLALNVFKIKGIAHSIKDNDYAAYWTDEVYGHFNGKDYYWQRGNALNPFVYFTLDLDNILLGYKPTRFYSLSAYAGGGIAIGFDEQFTRTAPTFNAGLINSFRLTDKLALVLNLRGALVGDDFEGESRGQEPLTRTYIGKNIPLDGIFGVTAGINIKFGQRKHQVFQKAEVYEAMLEESANTIEQLRSEGLSNAEIEKQLRDKLAKTQAELDALLAQPQPEQKDLDFQYHINFDIDKTELTNREIIDLEYISEVMKLDESKLYYLIGYADKQTGSVERNVWLSEHRVEEVFKCLTETYGVKPSQLVKSHEGGVDTMFLEDNTLSRCVVIYSEGKKIEK